MINNWIMVAIGGSIGSVSRYVLSGLIQRNYFGTFPIGTLFVNSTGCLLIGCVGAAVLGTTLVREDYRVLLMVGILGGYTTFSAFGWETISMLNDGQFSRALLNIVANNLIGLACVWFGFRVGRYWLGA